MTESKRHLPEVVSPKEWYEARLKLLEKEKELTRQRDALNAERRRLPMVKIASDYMFEGPDGLYSLINLFEDRRQLITYHFMFHPDWDQGCPACSFLVDNIGHLAHLHARNTNLVLVSRAPIEKIERYKARMGWSIPWYSSYGSDFNYEFHVTQGETLGTSEYNYRNVDELIAKLNGKQVELPGTSVFLRDGESVYHTYSSYARGGDALLGTYQYLDLTPHGRQEEWEEPEGRSDGPMMSWLRRHDEYEKKPVQVESS